MKSIFRWDSPLMQKIALAGNLVVLNVLWILFSLPIVSMGAATTALYFAVFQHQTGVDDTVLKPFIRAFFKNFVQSTLLWLPLLGAMILFVLDYRYLFAYGGNGMMWTAVVLTSVAVLLLQTQILPLVARFEMKSGAVLRTAASLIILHLPSSLLMALLNLIPVVFVIALPVAFMQWLPLWAGIWFSGVAYMNGKMLLKIWAKHMPSQQAENAACEEL